MVRRKRDKDEKVMSAEMLHMDRLQLAIERSIRKQLDYVEQVIFRRCFPSVEGGVVVHVLCNGRIIGDDSRKFVCWLKENGSVAWVSEAQTDAKKRAAAEKRIKKEVPAAVAEAVLQAKAAIKSLDKKSPKSSSKK